MRSARLVTSNDVVLVFPVTSIPLDLTCNLRALLEYTSTVPCGLIVTPLPTFTMFILLVVPPSIFAFISISLLLVEFIFKVEPSENIDLPVPKLIDLLSIILSVSLNVDTPDKVNRFPIIVWLWFVLPWNVDIPSTNKLSKVPWLWKKLFLTNKLPPTYKSPPVVVIPPEDAKVVIPATLKLPPTFKFFSIPAPPSVTKDPVSFVIDWVATEIKTPASDWTIPLDAFNISAAALVVIVFVSTLILPKVEIPVTSRSFKLDCSETDKFFEDKVSVVAEYVKSASSSNSPFSPTKTTRPCVKSSTRTLFATIPAFASIGPLNVETPDLTSNWLNRACPTTSNNSSGWVLPIPTREVSARYTNLPPLVEAPSTNPAVLWNWTSYIFPPAPVCTALLLIHSTPYAPFAKRSPWTPGSFV